MDENLEETVSADLNSRRLVSENVEMIKRRKLGYMVLVIKVGVRSRERKKKLSKKEKVPSTQETTKVVVDISSDSEHSKTVEGYRLFDLNMLSKLVAELLCQNCCDKQLYISENASKRKGLVSFISVKCSRGFSKSEYTSPCVQEGKGVKAFDINIRSVCNEKLWIRVIQLHLRNSVAS